MLITLTVLLLYQGVLLGLGFWARSRSQSDAGFYIGDYNLGPWVASLSYAAGSSSAWSILGVSGIAFSQGLSAIWLVPGTLTGHLVVWFYVAPRLQGKAQEKGWLSLTDALVDGLAPGMARLSYRLAALVILFSFTFYIAAQFQGAANTFDAVFGLAPEVALLIGALVVLIYTLWGGFWAVSLTDALQAGLMLLAALVLPLMAWQAVGGIEGITQGADVSAYWSLAGGHEGWFLIGFFLGMLSIGFGPIGQPHLLNRVMALRSPRDINLARTIALVWFAVVLGGMFLLGVCARLLLQGSAEPVAGEQVFFTMADSLLPPVMTGIVIAAVLSAIMSTADSQLLVAGAAVHNDLGGGAKNRVSSFGPRAAVSTVAVAAVLLALFLPEAIFSRVLFAWNALGAAFGPLLLARLFRWRIKDWAVPTAMLVGFGFTVVFYSLPNGPGDLYERAVPFILAFVTLFFARSSDR